jgi:hypothetical protein
MTEIDKIKKALDKRQMKVFLETTESVAVFWKDKEKTKFGYINKYYYHRYGVSTSITLKDGSQNPWFCSNDFADTVDQTIVNLMKSGQWVTLQAFTTHLLTKIQS